MTRRERVMAALAGHPVDRVPVSFGRERLAWTPRSDRWMLFQDATLK